jgi:hypothetical protein
MGNLLQVIWVDSQKLKNMVKRECPGFGFVE